MAIQFGPKFPKGNSVQGKPLPKPNTPINNESKPGATAQEYKDNREGVENGKPGDFTVIKNKYDNGYEIIYKDKKGKVRVEEYGPSETNRATISFLRSCDVYFGAR